MANEGQLPSDGATLELTAPVDAVTRRWRAAAVTLVLIGLVALVWVGLPGVLCFPAAVLAWMGGRIGLARDVEVDGHDLVVRRPGQGEVARYDLRRVQVEGRGSALVVRSRSGESWVLGCHSVDVVKQFIDRSEGRLPRPESEPERPAGRARSDRETRETLDGLEIRLKAQRTRMFLWITVASVLVSQFAIQVATDALGWAGVPVVVAVFLPVLWLLGQGDVVYTLGPRSLRIERRWQTDSVPYDGVESVLVARVLGGLVSQLRIRLADGSEVHTILGSDLDHHEIAAALRLRMVDTPSEGAPPELRALLEGWD